jgi:hypothetical protein
MTFWNIKFKCLLLFFFKYTIIVYIVLQIVVFNQYDFEVFTCQSFQLCGILLDADGVLGFHFSYFITPMLTDV